MFQIEHFQLQIEINASGELLAECRSETQCYSTVTQPWLAWDGWVLSEVTSQKKWLVTCDSSKSI